MVHKAERVIRGCITSKHIVRLFDTSDTLAEGVADFFAEPFDRRDPMLVVARGKNWKQIANALQRRGYPVADAVKSGLITVCDAHRALGRFMRNGQPVEQLFHASIGDVVGRLMTKSGTLWIYGEMVDVLAEERNFTAAQYLEELWNDLGLRSSLTLLCGYSAAHFSDPALTHVLAAICDRHTHVHVGTEDALGDWVLKKRPAKPRDPRAASALAAGADA